MTAVPAQYQGMVDAAATALGIPASVVAAQINLESGFDPGAVSPAGAEGMAQFMPGTFASYGVGSPFNPTDAMNAYTAYMRSLLNQFGGNLQDALAAYNAGPGNIGAGMGYANQILSAAGTGNVTGIPKTGGNSKIGNAQGQGSAQVVYGVPIVPSTGTTGGFWTDIGNGIKGAWQTALDNASQLSNVAAGVQGAAAAFTGIGSDFHTLFASILWIVQPQNWVRIFAGFLGAMFLVGGAILIATAG